MEVIMTKQKNLIGKRFGKLTVIAKGEPINQHGTNLSTWICQCDCGVIKTIRQHNLLAGGSKSCGCGQMGGKYHIHNLHNSSKTRLYGIWQGIKQRCFNPKNKNYHNYGGRGITICEQWKDNFVCFQQWALSSGYEDNLTIDRIEVNGNYEPNNCRWLTRGEQQNNKRDTHRFNINGEILTIRDVSERYNIDLELIRHRISAGYTIEEILANETKNKPSIVTYKGETHHIKEWSKIIGISESTIYSRIYRGLPVEKVLAPKLLYNGNKAL